MRGRDTPEPVRDVLSEAAATAKKTKRAILVHFSASWCGWCKRFEAAIKSPEVAPLIEKNYVTVKLIVQESPDKKKEENPGSDRFLAEMGGGRSGIPFLVFLDANGKKLADSNVVGPQKSNIGCPATPEEIAAFGELLKKTAPRLSDGDRARILDYFTRNAPKQSARR
jgi:uncharacterized protein YyaL (SSP411 family)